jgi:hypothetical protein
MYQAVLKDKKKQLKPMDKKGVCAIHYKSLTPKDLSLPYFTWKWGW